MPHSDNLTKWTEFWDMHSGGSLKEKWNLIYIEAPLDEAKIIFFNKFGHNCERVTCTCCGEDYSVSESESLSDATRYHRNDYDDKMLRGLRGKVISLEEFLKFENVMVIRDEDIKPEWRLGEVPRQGYVWVG